MDDVLGPGPTPPQEIETKVYADRRLDRQDGVSLLAGDNLAWLGRLAHARRTLRHGDVTLFAPTGRLDLGGACAGGRDRHAATGTAPAEIDEVVERARRMAESGVTELHLGTAHDAGLPWSHYPRVLRALTDAVPGVRLVGFSADDVRWFAGLADAPVDAVLDDLREAGLAVLAGDAAERLDEPGTAHTIGWDDWAGVHQAAHERGLPTVATVGYGGGDADTWVRLLLRLRDLQDATGGLLAVVPVPYPGDAGLGGAAPVHALRAVAAVRLLVDNVAHVAAAPAAIGRSTAQLALNFGADALGGPVTAAGLDDDRDDLLDLIRDAGLRPVERDARYAVVREYPPGPALAERRAVPQQVWV